MPYTELIKNFNRTRDYLRDFYVYGFKSRRGFERKSSRSYDNERRRIESWLKDYMRFRYGADGKRLFLSIDSREIPHNPLYKAWKMKSFTSIDIFLHFILLDILKDASVKMTWGEISEKVEEYQEVFETKGVIDIHTVKHKLDEYVEEGLFVTQKRGRSRYYSRAADSLPINQDILDLASEVMPCGVIGSYLLDREDRREGHFSFKHHYITSAMDSEILYELSRALREKRKISMMTVDRFKNKEECHVVPLRIMISVQSGRQYLMAYSEELDRITSFRLDNVCTVKTGIVSDRFEDLQSTLNEMLPHIWGVSTRNKSGQALEHVEFTIRYEDYEPHIPRRLEREKRCGALEYLDKNHIRFKADVYDSREMIPWIRTFIKRITDISFSNKDLQERFRDDLESMYALYGIGGGDENENIQ